MNTIETLEVRADLWLSLSASQLVYLFLRGTPGEQAIAERFIQAEAQKAGAV